MQFPGSHCFFGSKVISIVRRGGAGELLFRSKVISIVQRGGAGELLFRSKVISIVQRGGAGELLFRSKVIAQLSGEGVRVNCFSGQRSKSGGKMLDCFDAELYHEGTF